MEEVVLEELQIFKVRHSPEFWEERCWNWIALDIWHLCFNTSSLFLENSLQITPLFFFLKQWEKVFKATKNRTHLSLKNSTEFRALGLPLITAFSELIVRQIATADESLGSLLLSRCFSAWSILLFNFSSIEFEETGRMNKSCPHAFCKNFVFFFSERLHDNEPSYMLNFFHAPKELVHLK